MTERRGKNTVLANATGNAPIEFIQRCDQAGAKTRPALASLIETDAWHQLSGVARGYNLVETAREWHRGLMESEQVLLLEPPLGGSWQGETGCRAWFSQTVAEPAPRTLLKASVMPGGEA